MRVIAGGVLCFGVVQLPEAGVNQASVALEDLPLLADDWPGGNGGEFVLSIRLVKSSMGNGEAAKAI